MWPSGRETEGLRTIIYGGMNASIATFFFHLALMSCVCNKRPVVCKKVPWKMVCPPSNHLEKCFAPGPIPPKQLSCAPRANISPASLPPDNSGLVALLATARIIGGGMDWGEMLVPPLHLPSKMSSPPPTNFILFLFYFISIIYHRLAELFFTGVW